MQPPTRLAAQPPAEPRKRRLRAKPAPTKITEPAPPGGGLWISQANISRAGGCGSRFPEVHRQLPKLLEWELRSQRADAEPAAAAAVGDLSDVFMTVLLRRAAEVAAARTRARGQLHPALLVGKRRGRRKPAAATITYADIHAALTGLGMSVLLPPDERP